MSKREDILDGLDRRNWKKDYGLLYTCNAGWLDLGHLNPQNKRKEVGAANLWHQLLYEGDNAIDPLCEYPYLPIETAHLAPYSLNPPQPPYCEDDNEYKFPDGSKGFVVVYRQDHAGYLCKPGVGARYFVKRGLSIENKQRVGLSILQDVSMRFEKLQTLGSWVTDSGFSQEDLISNLIGYYIAIGKIARLDAIDKCKPVSDKAAYAIWDRYGPVGTNKNRSWHPKLAPDTHYDNGLQCCDDCLFAPRFFPKIFTSIEPAISGLMLVPIDYSTFSCF